MSPRIIESYPIPLHKHLKGDERIQSARVAAYAQDEDHRGGWYVELLDSDERVVWCEELDECGEVIRQAVGILAELDPDEVL
tara:strand:+ start:6663 stop:6908 length:246 start_codon:yes stop_codon:yes gene_type:complete